MRINEVIPWKRFGEWRLGHPKSAHTVAASTHGGVALPLPEGDSISSPQALNHPLHPANNTVLVTVLVENSVTGRNVRAEHGLSYFVRVGCRSLIFDTGQSELLEQNARKLGLCLTEVEAIALSHGHYDHTGGLPAMRSLAPNARLYLHPAALNPKFAGDPNGNSRPVGLPEESRQAIQQAGDRVVWTTRPTEVLDAIFVTGEIPRLTPFENSPAAFFLDESCSLADPLVDDQAMFFDTRDGIVVLLGCAHAGVVNTLEHIQRITHDRPIHTVLGGMHLLEAEAPRIAQTFARFRALDIRQLGPAHCTGVMPTARMRTEFPDRCVVCTVGSSLAFHRR